MPRTITQVQYDLQTIVGTRQGTIFWDFFFTNPRLNLYEVAERHRIHYKTVLNYIDRATGKILLGKAEDGRQFWESIYPERRRILCALDPAVLLEIQKKHRCDALESLICTPNDHLVDDERDLTPWTLPT